MCSPSWTLLPPPSPHHPSGSSQCTSPKHPASCIEPGLALFLSTLPFNGDGYIQICHFSFRHVIVLFKSYLHLWKWSPKSYRADPLEKEMATHFSILAWEIPWTEEPGELQFWGSKSRTQLKRLSTISYPFNCISKGMLCLR